MTEAAPASDPGLQPERTALAWRRTGLSLVAGSLLVGRLTMDTLGPGVLVPTGIAVVLGVWVISATARRRRRAAGSPAERALSEMRTDGRVPAVVTVVAVSLAVGELLSAVTQLLR